jgi:hypothetical protein
VELYTRQENQQKHKEKQVEKDREMRGKRETEGSKEERDNTHLSSLGNSQRRRRDLLGGAFLFWGKGES